MAGKTKIEWTEASWNPVVGCSIVSPGCTNCYAMKMAHRLQAMAGKPRWTKNLGGTAHYAGTTKVVNGNAVWTGKLALAPERVLTAPLRRKKPTTYFVNSMGDLFHEDCPDEWIDKVFAVMALCPQHTFQVLTKRAERMRTYVTELGRNAERDRANALPARWQIRLSDAHAPGTLPITKDTVQRHLGRSQKFSYDPPTPAWPLPNVWLGVSTEDQKRANERIPYLLTTPAAVHFISAEPLLGPIDLTNVWPDSTASMNALAGIAKHLLGFSEEVAGLDWVIAGSESGRGARPCDLDWVRSLRDQCTTAGVFFFWKQHAENGRKIPTPELDGRKWVETPATPSEKEAAA